MTEYTIRPMTDDSYETIADFINSTNPPVLAIAAAIRENDRQRVGYKIARWAAEQAGRLVGLGMYEQVVHMYDPTGVHAMVLVHPDHRQQGVGHRLYATLEADAAAQGILTVRGVIREDEPAAAAFAAGLGFSEEQRVFESTLDADTFDPAPYDALLPQLAIQGITLRSYAEAKSDPALDRAIYDLNAVLVATIPSPITYTLPSFEDFQAQTFNNAQVPHEGIILAFAGSDVVGFSYHRAYNADILNINFSAVLPSYRGRGIALALKVAGIRFAQTYGYKRLRTTNDSTNPAILALNRKLGFVTRPAAVMLRKSLP